LHRPLAGTWEIAVNLLRVRNVVALAVFASSLLACGGDPRDIYVGTYAISTLIQTTAGGTTTNSTTNDTLTVSEDGSDKTRIILATMATPQYTFTAVTTGNTFAIDTGVTYTYSATSTTNATCTITAVTSSGSGSRSAGAINYQFAANDTVSCSDNTMGTQTETDSISGQEND
jgi:hypothetical protein